MAYLVTRVTPGAAPSNPFGEVFKRRSQCVARLLDLAEQCGSLSLTEVDDDVFMMGDPKDGYAELYEIEETPLTPTIDLLTPRRKG